MANKTENRYVNVYIQSGEAQKVYDKLIAKQKALTEEIAKNPKNVEKLRQDLARLTEPIERAAKKMKGELSPSVRDADALVKKLANSLNHMSAEDADFTKTLEQYGQAKVLLNELKKGADQLRSSQLSLKKESFLGSFFGTLSANLILKVGSAVKDFLHGTTEEALQAEDALVDLKNSLENAGRIDLFQKLADQSEVFAEKFRTLDNDDITRVFTSLINYGKLTEDQIKETTEVIINYAAKQKISLEEASSVIIKGLEGNAKGLKTFGVNIKGATTFTERYGLIVGQLGDKLKGAELAFESTARGFGQSFGQRIRDLQERVGNFFLSLVGLERQQLNNAIAAKKDADQGTILVARYEELSKKTNITTAEKKELENITRSLASTFGSSVVEINKETGALTLNVEATKTLIKQKLLLANNKAAEVAAKLNAAEEKQAEASRELIVQTDLLNAKQKELGKTFAELDNSRVVGRIEDKRLQQLYDIGVNARTAQKNVSILGDEIKGLTKDLEALGFKKDDVDKLFKPGDPTKPVGFDIGDGGTGEKQLEKLKELIDKANKILADSKISILPDFDKELALLNQKFDAYRIEFAGHHDLLLKIEEAYQVEVIKIIQTYAGKQADAIAKAESARYKQTDESFKKNLQLLKDYALAFEANTVRQLDEIDRNRIAQKELAVFKATGLKKLKAQQELLDEQMRQELSAENLTADEKLLILAKYDEKRKALEVQFWTDFINNIRSYAQQATDLIATFDKVKTDSENLELERDQKLNDRKKDNLERRLRAGKLTQLQYDREMQQLEKEREKKEKEIAIKQFNRQKRAALTQAFIDGALAILQVLKTVPKVIPGTIIPNPEFPIALAFTIATKVAAIAAIATQKPPQYGLGGLTKGPAHSDKNKGMPVIDPYTGRIDAYVEGGEGISNKRTMADKRKYKIEGTPSQIISWLNARHGGVHWESGAKLVPAWKTYNWPSINYPGVKKFYADGGIFRNAEPPLSNQESTVSKEMADTIKILTMVISELQQTNQQLQQTLSKGIKAYTLLTEFEKQEDRLAAIRNDATMK